MLWCKKAWVGCIRCLFFTNVGGLGFIVWGVWVTTMGYFFNSSTFVSNHCLSLTATELISLISLFSLIMRLGIFFLRPLTHGFLFQRKAYLSPVKKSLLIIGLWVLFVNLVQRYLIRLHHIVHQYESKEILLVNTKFW